MAAAAASAAKWEALPTFSHSGLVVHRMAIEVPLVYEDIKQPTIVADKLSKLKRRKLTISTFRIRLEDFDETKKRQTLLYLQGGPGFQSFSPKSVGTWREHAARFGFELYLMDQRGTGASSKLLASNLSEEGGALDKAAVLACHRADSIIRDAEAVREAALGKESKWSVVLGQSFGGFCTLSYLSFRPGGLKSAILTGGLTDPQASAADVYRRTVSQMVARSRTHYALFPEDGPRVTRLLQLLSEEQGGPVAYEPLPAEAFERPAAEPSKGDSASGTAAALGAAASPSSGALAGGKRPRAGATGQIGPVIPSAKAASVRATEGGRLSQARLLSLGLRLGCGNGYKKLHNTIDTLWRAGTIRKEEEAVLAAVRAAKAGAATAADAAAVADDAPASASTGLVAGSPAKKARTESDGPTREDLARCVAVRLAMEDPGFDTNPLYAVLHESIYGQGGATRWAAKEAIQGLPATRLPRVAAESTAADGSGAEAGDGGGFAAGGGGGAAGDGEAGGALLVGGPVFLGECAIPEHFQGDFPGLRGLQLAADVLAEVEDWAPLYDEEALVECRVPCVAVVYRNDFFVPRDLALRAAGRYKCVRVWECDEEHTWLRDEPGMVREALRMLAEAPEAGIEVPPLAADESMLH